MPVHASLFTLAFVCFSTCAAQSPEYFAVGLGTLPPGFTSSHAYGMNDRGEVVGSLNGPSLSQAFVWNQIDGIQLLGRASSPVHYTDGWAINSTGVIAGFSALSGPSGSGVIWSDRSSPHIVGDLAGGPVFSRLYGINDAGVAVGYSDSDRGMRPVRWTESAGLEELGGFPSEITSAAAYGINEDGLVAGYAVGTGVNAFVWTPSTGYRVLDGLSTSFVYSQALAVNNNAEAVGISYLSGTLPKPVLWDLNGQVRELGTLFSADETGAARAINDAGVVVGGVVIDGESSAFVWSEDRGIRDLNQVTDFGGLPITLSYASAINTSGWISVIGLTQDGISQSVVLIPVPTPSVVAVVSLGSTVMTLRRRRYPTC